MLSFYPSTSQGGWGPLSVFRIYPCLSVPLRVGHWDIVARRWRCPLEVFPSTVPESLEGGQIFKLQKGTAMFSRVSSSSFERYLSFLSKATICWQIREGFYLRTEYMCEELKFVVNLFLVTPIFFFILLFRIVYSSHLPIFALALFLPAASRNPFLIDVKSR